MYDYDRMYDDPYSDYDYWPDYDRDFEDHYVPTDEDVLFSIIDRICGIGEPPRYVPTIPLPDFDPADVPF